MPSDIFQINNRDLKKLIKFYKRAPKLFGKAAAGVINTLAFENRKENIKQIKKTMTIRNEKFITGSIRVQQAKGTNIKNLMAIEGSIERPRFTGWSEQELSKRAKRKRLQTVHARGGSFQKRVRPSAKMRRTNKKYTYHSFQGGRNKTKGQATAAMLSAIRKGTVKRNPAVIESGLPGRMSRFKYGLYNVTKKKITRLQNLNPRNVQPKRNRWMTRSLRDLDKRVDLDKVWRKSLTIVLDRAVR